MKIPLLRSDLLCVAFGALLLCSTPILAENGTDDGAALKQAEELVHQAWNPAGDPPSVADRTQLLTKALDLIKQEPDHHLHHAAKNARDLINTALDALKVGDPGNSVSGTLRDADSQLRTAIQNAESH